MPIRLAMKILILMSLLLLAACNPEAEKLGANENDLVKYFKVTSANNGIGDGVLIVANIGDKRLLTFFLKQPSGKFAHTDVMIAHGKDALYEVESVYSQTPDCKLNPDKNQLMYYEQLIINGVIKPYNREILEKDEAMKEKKVLGC